MQVAPESCSRGRAVRRARWPARRGGQRLQDGREPPASLPAAWSFYFNEIYLGARKWINISLITKLINKKQHSTFELFLTVSVFNRGSRNNNKKRKTKNIFLFAKLFRLGKMTKIPSIWRSKWYVDMYYGGCPLKARKRTKQSEFTRHGQFEYRWWRKIDNTEIPATTKYLQCGLWSAPASRHNARDKANTETKTLTHKSYGTDYLFIFVRWTCAKGREQQENESKQRM